jgi:hypothetical protein
LVWRASLLSVLLAVVNVGGVPTQGVLDLLDGETLYDGGSLLTLGLELRRGEVVRQGERRVAGVVPSQETATSATLGFQHGLRHDLQLGLSLPFVTQSQHLGAVDVDAHGLGDRGLLGKWRFYRWDARGKAFNVALIGALSLPTGADDVVDQGMRLEPELQPGSGGIDPAVGFGATHEPGRWRFNAAALYRWRTDTDDDGARLGNETVAELAIGNRFWLEPYPGPFMRFDGILACKTSFFGVFVHRGASSFYLD